LSNMEKNGLLARNDLLKAQLQTSNIELALVNAENNMQLSMIALNIIIGLPDESALHIDTADILLNKDVQSFDSYETQALVKRNDIKALMLRHDAAEAGVKQAKGDYYPSIGLTGGYIAVDVPKVLTVPNAFNIGAGVQYNLSSLWKTKNKVNEAKAIEREIEATQELISDQVKMEIHQAYQDYFSSKKKIEVQTKAVENARENYRITKNKYDNSLVTTTDLLDANTSLLETEINLSTAKADIFSAYHTLLQRSGQLESILNNN
ncbi:MAG: TolC family protein, partial [Chitinophagaceae bacterium]|nr:TolC family protein [Chitinophagaceae bacterium]